MLVERDSALAAVVNGNQRSGMSALTKAVELAKTKALESGMAITGTYNTATSTGMLAHYAEILGEVSSTKNKKRTKTTNQTQPHIPFTLLHVSESSQ